MKTLTLNKNDMNTGSLILINAEHPLGSKHHINLVCAAQNHSNMLMERGAATALSHVFQEMEYTDKIVPVSGFRSKEDQRQIYSESLREKG